MRTTFGYSRSMAVLLTASLGASALAACSGGNPEPSTGAAPATTDTAPAGASEHHPTTPTADSTSAAAPAAAADTAADTAAAAASATSSTGPAPAAAPAAAPSPAAADSFLKFDPATNTVTFELVSGPFDFNGYTSGGATLTVPPGSNNVINFVQNDGTPHSAEIGPGTGPVPNSGGEAAIPRAYTNKLIEGLPQGATDVMRFTAPDSGSYRILCGVPGHALSGMWIWYKVDPAAKTPSFGATAK
jgi:plastocyanin